MELHKIIFKQVEEIINNTDPVGLVDGGSPDDEYHTEIGKIVLLLREEVSEELLADKIQNIFKESFKDGVNKNRDLYLTISKQLLNLKQRLRW